MAESVSIKDLIIDGTKLLKETRPYIKFKQKEASFTNERYWSSSQSDIRIIFHPKVQIITPMPFFYKDGKLHVVFKISEYISKYSKANNRGFFIVDTEKKLGGYDIIKIKRSWEIVSGIIYDHELKLLNSPFLSQYFKEVGVNRWIVKLLAINSPGIAGGISYIKHLNDTVSTNYFRKTKISKSVVFEDIKNIHDFKRLIAYKILATDVIENLEYTE